MSDNRLRIVITVPTAGRPDGISRLLHALPTSTDPTLAAEVAVIDNEPSEKTRKAVQSAANQLSSPITYVEEPDRGIPFARNTCVRTALDRDADALVFIDDDEWPEPGWLEALVGTWRRTRADVVLGPATAVLPEKAPEWARRSKVFDKDRRLPEGAPIRTAYSYNTLVSRTALQTLGPAFDPAFRYTGASDHDYFKQAAALGLVSVWSPDARIYEEVDPARLRLGWVFKRGYRIGAGATRSTLNRMGALRSALRIVLLLLMNLGWAGWHVLRSVRYRSAWVYALRRFGIVLGLVAGTAHSYEEYGRSRLTS
jgi:glycosyltransferase involved in cell wall biosynthesis